MGFDVLDIFNKGSDLRKIERTSRSAKDKENPGDALRRQQQDRPGFKLFVHPQEKRSRLQKEALGQQQQAEKTALAEAGAQQRTNEEQERKANARTPNIAALLSSAIASGAGGAASTILTGLGGTPKRLGGGR